MVSTTRKIQTLNTNDKLRIDLTNARSKIGELEKKIEKAKDYIKTRQKKELSNSEFLTIEEILNLLQ